MSIICSMRAIIVLALLLLTVSCSIGQDFDPSITPLETAQISSPVSPKSTEESNSYVPSRTLSSVIEETIWSADSPNGEWQVIATYRWGPEITEWSSVYSFCVIVESKDGSKRFTLLEKEGTSGFGYEGPYPDIVFWSPDGGRLYLAWGGFQSSFVFSRSGGLQVIDLSTGKIKVFSSDVSSPFAISPDEKYLAYFRYQDGAEFIELLNLDNSEVSSHESDIKGEKGNLVWSPDADYFAFSAVSEGIVNESSIIIVNPINFQISECIFTGELYVAKRWDENGLIAYSRGGSAGEFIVEPKSCNLTELNVSNQ